VQGQVSIGTSGWSYRHWRGAFYPAELPAKHWLSHYVQHFHTVELNTTFYRLPKPEAVDAWRASTPRRFQFAVKGSRFLTHMKKLADPRAGLRRFLPLAERLAPKLGPILFQLPPHWSCNLDRLRLFLEALPTTHDYAFELRDPSWLVPAVYQLLSRHNAALCIYHLAGFQSPLELTADFTYLRLHGPEGKYAGDYTPATLRAWARRIATWRRSLRHVFVYFDNDQRGFAAKNALMLKSLM
jgi:uncharacterized protein YecE (DUF72 family)